MYILCFFFENFFRPLLIQEDLMVLSLRMYLKKKYVLPYEEINIIDVRQCSQKHAINFILSPIKVNYRQLFLERSYVTLIKNSFLFL